MNYRLWISLVFIIAILTPQTWAAEGDRRKIVASVATETAVETSRKARLLGKLKTQGLHPTS